MQMWYGFRQPIHGYEKCGQHPQLGLVQLTTSSGGSRENEYQHRAIVQQLPGHPDAQNATDCGADERGAPVSAGTDDDDHDDDS